MRLASKELPSKQDVLIALTKVKGIGRPTARKVLLRSNVAFNVDVKDLTEEQERAIRDVIEEMNIVLGADVDKARRMSIKRLVESGSLRGMRHRKNLPVHGQRTRSNAKTRKKRHVE